MTFVKFKEAFKKFIEESNVNLGRKEAKTRQEFIDTLMDMLDDYHFSVTKTKNKTVEEPQPRNPSDLSDRLVVLKPDRTRALDIGKGVHAMTPSESMRADEQLNRSPFGNRDKGKDNG